MKKKKKETKDNPKNAFVQILIFVSVNEVEFSLWLYSCSISQLKYNHIKRSLINNNRKLNNNKVYDS